MIFSDKKKLNVLSIEKVFDLQTSNRSSFYLKIFYKQNIYTNGIGKFATKQNMIIQIEMKCILWIDRESN